MEKKRIKWGNILILLLIIGAAIYAFSNTNILKSHKPGDSTPVSAGTRQETQALDTPAPASAGTGTASIDQGTQATASSSGTEEKSPSASHEFVMGLDSWIGGTPSLMAISREYNKDYSLDFGVDYIPSDSERIAALAEGKIQATEVSLPSFIKQLEKYPDCGEIVGITDFSRGADGIVAKSSVKDLNDMEGRKVAYVKDGTGKFILNKFLRLTGLRYQDIIPVECEGMGDVIKALKAGDVDLAVSWSPDMNLAVKDINSQQPGSVRMLITTKEVPNLIPTVLVVGKKVLEDQPDKVDAFIKTWYASAKYIIEKPDKAYPKLVELMNENEDEYGKVALEDVEDSFSNIKLMSLNDNFGYFDLASSPAGDMPSIINDTIQTWKKYGDISGNATPDKLYTDTFMKQESSDDDPELMVAAAAGNETGDGQGTEGKKEFTKQDAQSVEQNTEKVAKVDIPPVYYDSGKAAVKAESHAVLDQIVDISKQFPEYYIIIDAHTDSVGSDEANLKLSQDRAAEVQKYLVSKGVDPNRIVARGWGEYRPVVSVEKTEADRAKNRRTEFTLTRDVSQN